MLKDKNLDITKDDKYLKIIEHRADQLMQSEWRAEVRFQVSHRS
jgi:hypothetical protein